MPDEGETGVSPVPEEFCTGAKTVASSSSLTSTKMSAANTTAAMAQITVNTDEKVLQ